MEIEKMDLSFEEAVDLLTQTRVKKITFVNNGSLVTAYKVGDSLVRLDVDIKKEIRR